MDIDAGSGYVHPNGTLYCDFMEYIKWRVEAVTKTVALVKTGKFYLHNRIAAETCILQLRMCCELLALGCVAIHSDVPQSAKLTREYNASEIMKRVARLKPKFFPRGITEKRNPDGTIVHADREGALTQEDLVKQYNQFGDWLHTGTLEKYTHPDQKQFDFSLLEGFVDKLAKLLNTHTYLLNDEATMIRVFMWNENDKRAWINFLRIVPASEMGGAGI